MHTYKRNGIEFYLLAGVGHHRAISLICLEGHSKSVIECEICNEVFPASRSLTILRICYQHFREPIRSLSGF